MRINVSDIKLKTETATFTPRSQKKPNINTKKKTCLFYVAKVIF